MACSREEIEQKRLAALEKRRKITISQSNLSPGINSLSRSLVSQTHSQSNNKSYHPYAKPQIIGNQSNVPVTKVVSGIIYLISERRFEVNPSEFCPPLISIFKTVPSRSFDAKSKLWSFDMEDYQLLMSKVAPLAPHVVLGTLPPYVLKILRETPIDPDTIDLSPVEASLRNKLMPFQAEGVRYGISRRGRVMIADDMGLGKTFQALAVASYYRHNWPLLIVTTSSMRETWQSKIHELLPSVPLLNIASLNTGRDTQLVADNQTEVVIVSYKITTMHADLLKSKKFGVVIIDESHYLKSHKAQCTIALNSITSRATRVVLLSGTPALSRPSELYTQLTLIEPHLFGNYTEYGKRYCAGKQTAFGWDMSGQSNLQELQVLLQRRFLIRRTKDQVTKLEEKTRETVILDSTLLQFTKEDAQELSQMAANLKDKRPQEKQAALLSFFSESARVKIPAICKYIKQLVLEESCKFLVFAHHKPMISAICLTLDEARVAYICITGSTPSHTRADLVDRFQYNDSCRCAVLSVTAANSGITLTAANLVLFAELHWNPGVLTQAEARAHRIGQRGVVCIRYLLATGTVDDYIWPMLQNKLNVLNDVGLSKDTFEDTKLKHQESSMNITQYLSPGCSKNRSLYIPGTNIRINPVQNGETNKQSGLSLNQSEISLNQSGLSLNQSEISLNQSEISLNQSELSLNQNEISLNQSEFEDIDKYFREDAEGDELLANLDFL